MTAALYELLRRDKRATFNDNDELPRLLSSMEDIARDLNTSNVADYCEIVNCVTGLQKMVERANNLVAKEEPRGSSDLPKVVPPNFSTEVVRPGGRHDNDHADIRNIKVLPTTREMAFMD
jgi:hypothetical protein